MREDLLKVNYRMIKMGYRPVCILIILALFYGCNGQESNNFWFLEKDKNYERVKEIFNDFIDFYPSKEISENLNSTWSINPVVEYNIKTVFRFKSDDFSKMQNEIEKNAIAKYSPTDECLFVLNRFSTSKNYGYAKPNEINSDLIDLACYQNLYPIPNFSNFSDYQTDSTACKLKEDFFIYVLESKQGQYLKDKPLTKGKYMPENWKNGFSKGIAINESEKLMIYWVILW